MAFTHWNIFPTSFPHNPVVSACDKSIASPVTVAKSPKRFPTQVKPAFSLVWHLHSGPDWCCFKQIPFYLLLTHQKTNIFEQEKNQFKSTSPFYTHLFLLGFVFALVFLFWNRDASHDLLWMNIILYKLEKQHTHTDNTSYQHHHIIYGVWKRMGAYSLQLKRSHIPMKPASNSKKIKLSAAKCCPNIILCDIKNTLTWHLTCHINLF